MPTSFPPLEKRRTENQRRRCNLVTFRFSLLASLLSENVGKFRSHFLHTLECNEQNPSPPPHRAGRNLSPLHPRPTSAHSTERRADPSLVLFTRRTDFLGKYLAGVHLLLIPEVAWHIGNFGRGACTSGRNVESWILNFAPCGKIGRFRQLGCWTTEYCTRMPSRLQLLYP